MEPTTEQATRLDLIERTLMTSSIEITTLHGAPLDVDIKDLFATFQRIQAREQAAL